MAPAPSCGAYAREPSAAVVGAKSVLLSSGDWKLAWLRTLKNSTLNWVLNLSDIRLKAVFLKTEKSRFVRPGPAITFRRALPTLLMQVGKARIGLQYWL